MTQSIHWIELGKTPFWMAILVAFNIFVFVGCNSPTNSKTEPKPEPGPKSGYTLNLSDSQLTCTEGDTVWVTAEVPSDSSHQPVHFLNLNAAIAAVFTFNSDTVRISCLNVGAANIEVQWTNGLVRLTDTIMVTVTAPTHRAFQVRVGYVPSDAFLNPFGLTTVIAWRYPSRDSVVGAVGSDGFATFSVPVSVANVMDSVTIRIDGGAFHHSVKYHFRRAINGTEKRFVGSTSAFVYDIGGVVTSANSPRFNFVMALKRYTIPLGRDMGKVVDISIEKLYQKGPAQSPWMRVGAPFKAAKYPLTVCINRAKSNIPITAFDSTAWLKGVQDSLNGPLGVQIYKFGTTNCDLELVADSTLSNYGGSQTGIYVPETPSQLVAIFDTVTAVHQAARTMTHEGMHALGFGHTDAWTGILNVTGGAWVTFTDAAGFHLPREMNLVAIQMGGALGLEAANEALK